METILFENCTLYQDMEKFINDGCILSRDGCIIYSGLKNDLNISGFSIDKTVNLENNFVFPGFTDSHVHLSLTAEKFAQIDLYGCKTLNEIAELIRKKDYQSGEWITGHGWELEILFRNSVPSIEFLDNITPDNPVFLVSKDWHSVYINSIALKKILEIDIPETCVIEKKDGKYTGLVFEEILTLKERAIPPLSSKQKNELWPILVKEFHRNGITSVHNNENIEGYNFILDSDREINRKLRILWNFMLTSPSEISKLENLGKIPRWLVKGGIKLFMDGTLGSRTAAITHKYPGTDSMGLLNMDEKTFTEWVRTTVENNLYCVFHTIGDRSTEFTINTIEKEGLYPENNLKHRLEHIQFLTENTLKHKNISKFIFSAQPSHMDGDYEVAQRNLSEKLINLSYPFSSILKNQSQLVFGSDSPIEGLSVWKGIRGATQRSFNGNIWNRSEKISLKEALTAHTVSPALIQDNPFSNGSLKSGNVCDFIVLDKDPILEESCLLSENNLPEILMTVIDGQIVYRK